MFLTIEEDKFIQYSHCTSYRFFRDRKLSTEGLRHKLFCCEVTAIENKPDLVAKYGGRVVMTFEGTNWMNQELTEDYLSKVIGFPMFTPNRLLVWDSFKCHISEATKRQ